MAESVLLADGSNQHSASVQLVSAREYHSSTAARAPKTLLQTGGEERESRESEIDERRGRRERQESHGT